MQPLKDQAITKANSDAIAANFDEIDSRCGPVFWEELPEPFLAERRTPNIGLVIPALGALDWARSINYNFDVIDRILKDTFSDGDGSISGPIPLTFRRANINNAGNRVKVKAFRPFALNDREKIMYRTADSGPTVPSFYVNELLITIQELRDAQVQPSPMDRSRVPDLDLEADGVDSPEA